MNTQTIATIALLGVGTPLFACHGVGGWAGLTPTIDPNRTMMVYDPANGNTVLHINHHLASLYEIKSTESNFIPENANPLAFNGLFDIVSEEKLFKLDPSGLRGSWDLGEVLPTGLNGAFLMEDLSIEITCESNRPLLHIVPEPNGHKAISILVIVFLSRQFVNLRGVYS